MSETILKIENISKQYRLGLIGTGTLKHDLTRWWYKVRGMEDPFLKVGEINDRSKQGNNQYIWALKDINFDVKQGEVIGIIGKNGAGKSTLLKILSRVTSPTTGEIKTKGRIASLLEVGTGFHYEMTGRENIYLNGAVLGMTKTEIRSKIDDIISFSGCQRYIDTPVKRYSSGMIVRLAFAVAAHLEPDILIVDEVLAVGDAEFQKKAIGKIKDISSVGGRTVLFVSHNLAAVKNLCNKGIVLKNGMIQYIGKIDSAIAEYLKQFTEDQREITYKLGEYKGTDFAQFTHASIRQVNPTKDKVYIEGDSIKLFFEFYIKQRGTYDLGITFHLVDELGTLVFVGSSCEEDRVVKEGYYKESVVIPENIMNEGIFTVTRLLLVKDKGSVEAQAENVIQFQLLPKRRGLGWAGKKEGVVKPKLNWVQIT